MNIKEKVRFLFPPKPEEDLKDLVDLYPPTSNDMETKDTGEYTKEVQGK